MVMESSSTIGGYGEAGVMITAPIDINATWS